MREVSDCREGRSFYQSRRRRDKRDSCKLECKLPLQANLPSCTSTREGRSNKSTKNNKYCQIEYDWLFQNNDHQSLLFPTMVNLSIVH